MRFSRRLLPFQPRASVNTGTAVRSPRVPARRSSTAGPAGHGHDFSRLPVHASTPLTSDRAEEEADRVSAGLATTSVSRQREGGEQGAAATQAPSELADSAGQPLSSSVRAMMEPRLGHDLAHVRIHADASAARSAESLDADAFTYGSHIAFGPGRFAPGTGEGNALMAHELVHSIQQVQPPPLSAGGTTPMLVSQAVSPHIARRPKKSKKVTKKPAGTLDAGLLLGKNQAGEEVRIEREVGSTGGYDHRLQAIAVARLNGADPAVIVEWNDRKWHAFKTTATFDPAGMTAEIPALGVHRLPSSAGIDAMQKSQPNSAALASLVFGVPESEIQMNRSSADRTAGKINMNPQIGGPDQPGGMHGPVDGVDFAQGVPSAIEIGTPTLADPASAQVTLFHEATHLRDYELAQQWVATYEREGGTFLTGPGARNFTIWLYQQTRTKPPRLSEVDAELIADEVTNVSSATEARANVMSFLVAFEAGKFDLAQTKLVAYAEALKPGGLYENPVAGSAVQAALIAELRRVERQLPRDQRARFRRAFAAAKAKNPEAWLSELGD